MTNIFSELKNMNHQLSNAPSTVLLRRLDIFLHFETYVFQNPPKPVSGQDTIYQLDFLPHIYMRQEAKLTYVKIRGPPFLRILEHICFKV